MKPLDFLIVAVYLAVIACMGVATSRRQDSDTDFFLANRSMHWLPIGLSITLTAFSGINYTAFSTEVFGHGLYVALSLPVFVFAAFPVIRIVMPFYHRLGVCSAYEYLENRFDVRVRTLASGLFIIWRIFWMATALYVPARVLALLTGQNLYGIIFFTGAAVTAYTAAGGIRAAMWTDVFQFIVLVGGLMIILYLAAIRSPGGVAGIVQTGMAGGLMKPFCPFDPDIFSLDPRTRITLWSAWIGTFVVFMSRYGVDQVMVQRYFTAKSLSMAKVAFHLSYAASIFSLILLAMLGFSMYSHAAHTPVAPIAGSPPMAWFVLFFSSLPAGATGLVVTGLAAATMSSVDSGINSCCTAFVTDFYRRFCPGRASLASSGINRRLSLIFGMVATFAAMGVSHMGTVFEIANKIINGFGSPLLAIFLLGMFSSTAGSRGMLAGGILGTIWSAGVSFGITGMALHYYAVINFLGTWLLCSGGSWIDRRFADGGPSTGQLAWTWQNQHRKKP
ncbi:MAG: sodium/solute symporter [Desulfotignum sp.]